MFHPSTLDFHISSFSNCAWVTHNLLKLINPQTQVLTVEKKAHEIRGWGMTIILEHESINLKNTFKKCHSSNQNFIHSLSQLNVFISLLPFKIKLSKKSLHSYTFHSQINTLHLRLHSLFCPSWSGLFSFNCRSAHQDHQLLQCCYIQWTLLGPWWLSSTQYSWPESPWNTLFLWLPPTSLATLSQVSLLASFLSIN